MYPENNGYRLFNRRLVGERTPLDDIYLDVSEPRPKGFYFDNGENHGHYIIKTLKNDRGGIMKETYIKKTI